MALRKPELLAPVGNMISLKAAISAGCDAIYFGIKNFNMREGAKNFEFKDVKNISKICRENGVKLYLTLNIIVYDEELKKIDSLIKKVKNYIDAIICWDLAVIELCKKHNVEIHISTQASVSNHLSSEYYKKRGAKRIVFARECNLDQIKKIIKKTKIESEVFIHGAMCVAISGRCFMSQFSYGRSANRGQCLQNCRREYLIKDIDREYEFKLGNNYVMSAKDLCTLPFIDQLMFFDSLKIEGRNRSPEYVKTVVSVYRRAIDAFYEGVLDKKLKNELMNQLKLVYNRDFSSGFYLGKPINEFTDEYGSKAIMKKEFVGKVINYYKKKGVVEIKITSNIFKKGDILMVQGNKTGVEEFEVSEILQEGVFVDKAKRGDVTLKVPFILRRNDFIYVLKKR